MEKIWLKLNGVTKNKDGTFEVKVNAIRSGGGGLLGSKTFIATTKKELKDLIRPFYKKLVDEEKNLSTIKDVVMTVLQDLEDELYQE